MTSPDFRALCAELVKLVERCPVTSDIDWICDRNELIVRFHNARRATLAQPAPEPPLELAQFVRNLRIRAEFLADKGGLVADEDAYYFNRAADILEQFSEPAGEGMCDTSFNLDSERRFTPPMTTRDRLECAAQLRAIAREIHSRRDLDSRGKLLVWLRAEADRAEAEL